MPTLKEQMNGEKYPLDERRRKTKEENLEVIDLMFRRINGGSREFGEDLFEHINLFEHRTLVQSFWRVIFKGMKSHVDKTKKYPTWVDGRNQDSYEWVLKLAEVNGFFPLI